MRGNHHGSESLGIQPRRLARTFLFSYFALDATDIVPGAFGVGRSPFIAVMPSDRNKQEVGTVVKHGMRSPCEEYHRQPVVWGVPDFIGKFHLNRMTTSTPIPGTAIRIEQERNAFMEKRASSMQAALDSIEARRRLRVMSRTRKAAITARVQVQATVGYRMDAGKRGEG